MSWRVARGLEVLLHQLDELAPNRSRASDGSIGDPAHQTRPSDHNPDALGIVRARDFTHDPDHADMGEFSEALRRSRDRRIAYAIFNRRIFSATVQPWLWRPYPGDNPHTKHLHVSVVATAVADDTTPWEITMPLSNDDIKRVSDATAAKVLGRAWQLPGRTLAGSIEAIIAYVDDVDDVLALLTQVRDLVAAGAGAGELAPVMARVDALQARVAAAHRAAAGALEPSDPGPTVTP